MLRSGSKALTAKTLSLYCYYVLMVVQLLYGLSRQEDINNSHLHTLYPPEYLRAS